MMMMTTTKPKGGSERYCHYHYLYCVLYVSCVGFYYYLLTSGVSPSPVSPLGFGRHRRGAVIRKIFYPMLGHPLELSRLQTPQMDSSSKPVLAFQTLDPSPIGVKLRGKIFGLKSHFGLSDPRPPPNMGSFIFLMSAPPHRP